MPVSFWIQHGAGKSDKIERIRSAGLLDGVIFSPAHEDRPTLKATIDAVRAPGIRVVLDPQLYVHTIGGGAAARHKSHGLEVGSVHWSADTKAVRQHVKNVIGANTKLGTDLVLTPTPLQSSFIDAWASLALQYARGVADEIPSERVLVSVVLDETGLDEWDAVADWLDIATQLEVAGFYIVIARQSGTYPGVWKAARLTNLLRLIYRLGVVNEYEVILGYSEVEGLAAVAIGAGMATGWSHRLRRFAESQWQAGPGFGQPPTPRIFSERLLSAITVSDARSLFRSEPPDLVGATVAERAQIENGGWGTTETRTQYVEAMARCARRFAAGSLDDRLDRFGKAITRARADFVARSATLAGAPRYDALLAPYSVAFKELRASEDLAP